MKERGNMRTGKPLTAKERTVSMPGVSMIEQENRAAKIVSVDGPEVKRIVLVEYVRFGTRTDRIPLELHLTHDGKSSLCMVSEAQGEHLEATMGGDVGCLNGKICMACRIEASRLRAVVR